MIANTVFVFACILVATLLRFCLVHENRKLAEAELEQNNGPKPGEDVIQSQLGGFLRLSPGFRYTL